MRDVPASPSRPTQALPPGPRWPALLQSTALLRFRHRFTPALQRRYGDVFTVRLVPRRTPLVIFTRPEHAKEIFAGDPEIFHAGKANVILAPVMGEHSLLLLDSSEHKRARRLLMPAFNGAALRGYAAVVAAIAREEVATWTPGAAFRSHDRMNALTLEVILRVVFGVTDGDRLAQLRPLVNATVDVSPVVLLGGTYPFLRRFGPWKATVDTQRELNTLIYAEIADRRRALSSTGGDGPDNGAGPDGPAEDGRAGVAGQRDVLSQLIAGGRSGGDELSDAELRDQLVTLLLAGHETTATALAWALYELGRHPEIQAKAAAAAVDADADAHGGDDYLEAVMKESMRLHPVIPLVARYLVAPATVAGWRLPAGTSVGPSILLSHARADNFAQPEVFRPERFLEDDIAPNTWIPFGGGVRRCIGAGFSLMEGVAVLRETLRAYEITLPPGTQDVPKVRNITSVPRYGARIIVTPRVVAPVPMTSGGTSSSIAAPRGAAPGTLPA